MATTDPLRRVSEIVAEIDIIRLAVAGRDRDTVAGDRVAVRAIERSPQIISEAAIKLGAQAELLAPGLPWVAIRGLGNVLRHDYDEIDFLRLWETIGSDLESLRQQCESVLAKGRA